MSARDVMSTGAGDVGEQDKSFVPSFGGGFTGGSLNKGVVNMNLIILVGVAFIGYALVKKMMK